MTEDTGELTRKMVRAADEVLERRAQAVRAASAINNDSFALLLFRNLCWAGAALGFVVAFGLSCMWWAEAIVPAVGVIHWFVVGLVLAFLGAVTLQATINQRRTAAGQRRIVEQMDAAAGKLREEIRDARPTDAVELARLVALHEATQAQLRHLGTTVNLMGGALQRKFDAVIDCAVDANDEAFVDALSKQEDRPKTNGHKAVRLVRPRTYDDDRHGR